MGSQIFRTMMMRKIDTFANSYGGDSSSLFKRDGRIFHNLEYGMYRERVFKELIGFLLKRDVRVSDGFIITDKDTVSTQCDLIIYDSNVIPLIDDSVANFFPVEIVRGVGEIKSNMSKQEFKDALIKLANNKQLSDHRSGASVDESNKPLENRDLISFLVCNKFEFKLEDIDFNEIYGGIPQRFWHNAILSVHDGVFLYTFHSQDFPRMRRTS